jgi:hypothetical protein
LLVNTGTKLALIGFVANDFNSQTAKAVFTTAWDTVGANTKLTCPYISIMPPLSGTAKAIPQTDYEDIAKARAITDGYAWIDIHAKWGTYAEAVALGFMHDTVHSDQEGHDDITKLMLQLLPYTGL